MKLLVNDRDRGPDLGTELTRHAHQRPESGLAARIEKERPLLSLSSAGTGAEYLERHIELLRSRNCADPAAFTMPGGRGLMGIVRRILWKLTRWQTDSHAFAQNAVNVQLAYELEFEKQERRQETAELLRRIDTLEDRDKERE